MIIVARAYQAATPIALFVRRPPPGNDDNEKMNSGKDDYDDRKF